MEISGFLDALQGSRNVVPGLSPLPHLPNPEAAQLAGRTDRAEPVGPRP